MARCSENEESFAGGTACRFWEKERADGSHMHSSSKPEGSVHFIINPRFDAGALWDFCEDWVPKRSGVGCPCQLASLPDSACRYVLLIWDHTVGYPFRVTPDEDIRSELQHVGGEVGGGVRGKNCHALSGCSSSKGQDCSSQEARSQLAGLLASASLLMRDSENFLFLLLNYLVKVIIFSVRSILCLYSAR